MGFKLGSNTLRLVFDDTILGGAYSGLEAVMDLDVSLRDYYDFRERRYGPTDNRKEAEQENFRWFGEEVLQSWTLQDKEGNDIPSTAEGLSQAPPRLTILLIDHWQAAMVDISDPLEPPSRDGSS